jgi:hypothetical protein
LKLGRQPDDRRIPRVKLKALPGVTITPPASADWTTGVPASALGMLGNDAVGDCVAAGAFHSQQIWEGDAQGVATSFSTQDALAMYSSISGYTPNNPNSDVGATLISGLQYWSKTGLDGYKLAAYAQIDSSNVALVQACIALFGVVYTGLNVPSSAMTQFDQGQPWAVVARSRIEGGHCVPLVGYDASGFTCVTWSAYQKLTTGFYQRYFDEAWVPVDEDWISKTGLTPSGLDGATANADFQGLTGSTASPFPTTTPTPGPTPTPTPTPPGTDDATLWAAAQVWAQSKGLSSADVPPHHGH